MFFPRFSPKSFTVVGDAFFEGNVRPYVGESRGAAFLKAETHKRKYFTTDTPQGYTFFNRAFLKVTSVLISGGTTSSLGGGTVLFNPFL